MQKNPTTNNHSFNSMKPLSTFHSNIRALLQRGNSDDMKRDRKNIRIDKIKLELADYLVRSQYDSAIQHQPKSDMSGEQRLKKFIEGRRGRSKQKRQTRLSHLFGEKTKKKQEQEKDEQFSKVYKKAFTIKEIQPQLKYKLTKQAILSTKNADKTAGSYYQIIALQKKFDHSQYFFNATQGLNIFKKASNNTDKLKNRYGTRLNPSSSLHLHPKKKRQKQAARLFDGNVLQPWNNHDEFYDNFHV